MHRHDQVEAFVALLVDLSRLLALLDLHGDDAGRIERARLLLDAPHRLVWWWAGAEEPATRVEFLIVAGAESQQPTRVIVTESEPSFPLAMLAAGFTGVFA